MARKSRANISQTSMVRKSRKTWYVGLYIRLSKEDEHPLKHDDSESVKNQEKILRAHFAALDDGDTYEIVKVFIEMKISKMIQFENTNPPRKRRNKGFRHIRCCRESLFFVPWNDCV